MTKEEREHLRDYLAGQAMCGILACTKEYEGIRGTEERAGLAYDVADAMLIAREK